MPEIDDTYYVAVVTADSQRFLGPFKGESAAEEASAAATRARFSGASAAVIGVR